jgi:hypothetical protein
MDNTTNLERQVGSEDKRVEFSVWDNEREKYKW